MKMLKIIPIFTFALLLSHIYIGHIYKPFDMKKFPRYHFNDLLDGTYVRDINKFLSKSLFFHHLSGVHYRKFLFDNLNKITSTIVVKNDSYLFNPYRLYEFPKEKELKTPILSEIILPFKKKLKERGIDLIILPVPSRSYVFRDFAYKNKAEPKNRKKYYSKIYKSFQELNITYFDSRAFFNKLLTDKSLNIYFKVDHHWTYKTSQIVAKEITGKYLSEYSLNKDKPYNVSWQEKFNPRNSFLKKLGFYSSIPKSLVHKYKVPTFTINKNIKSIDEVCLLSSSFGNYGIYEFLSNELGGKICKFINTGMGAMYSPTEFLLKKLKNSNDIKKIKKIIWIIPEYYMRKIIEMETAFPTFDPKISIKTDFKIYNKYKEIIKKRLQTDSKNKTIYLKFNKNVQRLTLNLKTYGGWSRTLIRVYHNDKDYTQNLLIHSGESFKYSYDLGAKNRSKEVRIEFVTLNWNRKLNRTIIIEDIFTHRNDKYL
jgi:hypothetical protein